MIFSHYLPVKVVFMKRSLALFLALFLAAPLLFAQENGLATPLLAQLPTDKTDALPAQPAAPATQGIPLLPQTPPADSATENTDKPAQDTGKKKSKKAVGPSRTDAAEDAMQLHIKLREAKTKALQDPALQAELAKADRTKTDYDRREAYKRYYVLLYARMLQIDPSLAAGINAREGTSFSRIYQYRVTPTVPRDQLGQAKPTGPENALAGSIAGGGTPPPVKSFGQARIGSY